ncbi:thyrotropin-releasing hormone receptor-like [Dreissena polymorpha]|uniref:thyrotropin-releasing hormone receptor-like n=1 Tax=Dreissena polymorpha TaxID=45954 RepID=UPI002264FAD0|nr:thyrotropin-releasing hormone receptor-like [Dreissena polymorpha]
MSSLNETVNTTMQHSNATSEVANALTWINAVRGMRQVGIPVIIFIGFCGNALSLVVFSKKRMRRTTCSVFLTTLAIVDNTFLLALLASWIDNEVHNIFTTSIACKMFIYVTYVTCFLSVWCVVGFSCERYIAICFPLKQRFMCSVIREKLTILGLGICACLLYIFSFWTSGVQKWNQQWKCVYRHEYIDLMNVVTWMDTVLTMVVPFTVIVIVNTLVLRTMLHTSKQRVFGEGLILSHHQKSSSSPKAPKASECLLSRCSDSHDYRLSKNSCARNKPIQNKTLSMQQTRVTRTLLSVSFTFLILNLPSHAMRLFNLIASLTSNTPFGEGGLRIRELTGFE